MGAVESKSTAVACVCAASAVAGLVYLTLQPIWVWKLRHIPGPKRKLLFGNLKEVIASGDFVKWREQMARKYGPVYKVWNGGNPMVMVNEASLARKVLLQNSSRPSLDFFVVITGDNYTIHSNGLLNLPGHTQKFRTFRKAYESILLRPQSLASYAQVLSGCSSRLVQRLSHYASSHQPCDVSFCLSDMSMDAIAFIAFGIDFDCLARGTAQLEQGKGSSTPASSTPASAPAAVTVGHQPGSAGFTQGLVEASRAMFRLNNFTRSSKWKIPNLLFPSLCRPISHLANWLPDAPLKEELKARGAILTAMRALIARWTQERQDLAGAAAAGGGIKPAMSDRGFMSQLLAARQAEGPGKEAVSDLDIMAQVRMMLLAGYETTASALSMSLYLLAENPEVQARAQQEVDRVLGGKAVEPSDLDHLPYLRAVFDEALRLYPTADAALRTLTEDLDVQGSYRIPRGTSMWVNLYAIQRDPAVWGPTATQFIPERHMQPGNEQLAPTNPAAFMPFGHGARMCPGYRFALMEAHLALAKMLQAFTFSPAPGCPPPKMHSAIVYSPGNVWLTVTSRAAS